MYSAAFLEERLKQHFPDAHIQVFDLTGGGDHWEVKIASSRFKGLTRIRQHQLVMEAFANELKDGSLHALSIKTEVL
ncbi:MAG: BolA/IbaG family iron-sulfur metabolism protein [Bdellovibrionaceae bacterium]|jgi:stress-induced morphogen|nr:BolA/IbaG family iron-sulfur metabolism protein [Pseudobdellovibrionaceae bacterium]